MSIYLDAVKAKLKMDFVRKKYDAGLITALQNINRETQVKDRQREAGKFGGLLRSLRAEVRADFADGLMQELDITPTATVAKTVMRVAFNQAAGNAALCERFAQNGRDASKKFVDDAVEKLQSEHGVAAIAAFSDANDTFAQDLADLVKKLKVTAFLTSAQ